MASWDLMLRSFRVLRRDTQLITRALNGTFKDVSDSELLANLAQISRHAALVLTNGGVADDSQIRDLRQIR